MRFRRKALAVPSPRISYEERLSRLFRYYNKYAYSTSIAGDGMGIFGQSATYPTAQYPTFIRKGIFGADSDNWGGYGSGVGCGSSNISTYAVVVCGTDI